MEISFISVGSGCSSMRSLEIGVSTLVMVGNEAKAVFSVNAGDNFSSREVDFILWGFNGMARSLFWSSLLLNDFFIIPDFVIL